MSAECIIHRDIKPSNILLCKHYPTANGANLFNCTVRIADLGAAVATEKASSPDYGTPAYWAPEVVETIVYQRRLSERRQSGHRSLRDLLPLPEA
ncbi:hypothetical protein AAVH_40640, partial [Aphelenchoides avenae]